MYSLRYNEQAAREAALDDGRIEGRTEGRAEGRAEERTEGIKTLIATIKDISASQPQAIEQLMKRYSLTHEQAQEAVQANW